jgi:hypothetical protein
MYVCLYVYMYICFGCITCIHAYMHTCTYIQILSKDVTHADLSLDTYTYLVRGPYARTSFCRYMHSHIHTYIHTYIQTYMHTLSKFDIHADLSALHLKPKSFSSPRNAYCLCVYIQVCAYVFVYTYVSFKSPDVYCLCVSMHTSVYVCMY